MASKSVVVLGGGVAGLSAAHELIERGFVVDVYEKTSTLGGKAKSNVYPVSGPGAPLPGEHGFRFFPGFYQHLPDTMSRIPAGASSAFENLVPARQTAIAQETKPLFLFPTYIPKTLQDWALLFDDWYGRAELGLKSGEADFFASCLLDFMSTCTKRRFAELDDKKWWDYIDAQNHSVQYQKLCAAGLTRSLVAMKAEEASTRTVGTILVQMMMSMTSQSGALDRVLNAPTNDAWIKPWTDYLSMKGVTFHVSNEVQGFQFDGSKITGVTLLSGGSTSTVTADYYLASFPVEIAKNLFTPLLNAAPSLQQICKLKTEWMNGIQFYLARDVRCCAGHIICADSTWAITCISQPQFWSGIDMGSFGDGTIAGLMSIDISAWDEPGTKTTTKTARQCTTAKEVADEVWAQLFDHLSSTNQPLMPSDEKCWFLDPSISFPVTANSQPLLVNTVGSWEWRPNAVTEIPNLFLASDYVRTNTDLATMEAANEAARRAVNGILTASNSSAVPCAVWPFRESAVFDPLKQIDEWLFDHGLPNPGFRALRLIAEL
jgi:uncharacterized protein with NAD-binding domain and iron-sulfur cluster